MLACLLLLGGVVPQNLSSEDVLLRKEQNITCADWAKLANHYISIGEQKTKEELQARTSDRPTKYAFSNRQAAHIIRLLFESKSGTKLRRPMLGGWLHEYYLSDRDWPCFPFANQDGVWFLLVEGYRLAGVAEPWETYFNYCQENGTFRTKLFEVPTSARAVIAFEALLISDNWKQDFHVPRFSSLHNWLKQQAKY